MKRAFLRFVVLSMLFVGAPGLTSAAMADHLEIEASLPESVTVGDIIDLQIVVRVSETGRRLPEATVVAYRDATITGTAGQVEIARVKTDELGIAVLRWQERGDANLVLTIAYLAPGEVEFETTLLSEVKIDPGSQIERSTSGVKIPGIGAWILIAVLVGVWALIQFALLGPVQVALDTPVESAAVAGEGRETLP